MSLFERTVVLLSHVPLRVWGRRMYIHANPPWGRDRVPDPHAPPPFITLPVGCYFLITIFTTFLITTFLPVHAGPVPTEVARPSRGAAGPQRPAAAEDPVGGANPLPEPGHGAAGIRAVPAVPWGFPLPGRRVCEGQVRRAGCRRMQAVGEAATQRMGRSGTHQRGTDAGGRR